MKTYLTYTVVAFFAITVLAIAGPDKAMIMAKEQAAWDTFKAKDAAGFKKVVDKDFRGVYGNGFYNRQKELDDMSKWDIKSVTVSDFDTFSDEPDVVVATYKVTLNATFNGQDMSGAYNAGTVWKKEGNDWLAIFHTHAKAEPAAAK